MWAQSRLERFEELWMPATSAMGLEACLPGGVIVRGYDAPMPRDL